MEHNAPKRRHIKFGRRWITQKKAYNIQNMAKVWYQEVFAFILITDIVVGKQDVSKGNELNICLCVSVSANISVKIAGIRLGVLISNSGV